MEFVSLLCLVSIHCLHLNMHIPVTHEEEDWEDLFHYINRKDTTPFLAAGIAREHFGSGYTEPGFSYFLVRPYFLICA